MKFNTLSDFYHSKEWERFRPIVIDSRTDDKGTIYCEYCGKPIVKTYDCILHHTEELTEANVNDVLVSLNPELIQLVHHACHNKIHNKLGYANRQVYVVYGSPLSGKSVWVDKVKQIGDLIIDMDSIWQCISGCDRYIKPNRLRSVAFGIRDELIDMVRTRRGKWLNAYVIGGYPLQVERERLINMLGAREVFIDTDRKECIKRLMECEDGRDKEEWMKFIDEWWNKFNPTPP